VVFGLGEEAVHGGWEGGPCTLMYSSWRAARRRTRVANSGDDAVDSQRRP
jgi:hypothetical protein